jgi:hypothetical protein
MSNYFYLKGRGFITKWSMVEEPREEKYAIKKIIK